MKLPESVNSFINNYKDKHPEKKSNGDVCCKNIYHIQTEDRSGNITGEYFGSNLITDTGFSRYIYDQKTGGSQEFGLDIGTGTGTISRSDTTLFNLLKWQEQGGLFENGVSTGTLTPVTFDQSTGYLSQFVKLRAVTFDYNLDGVTTDQTITEIGINDHYNSQMRLVTHSKIYDLNGDETTFVKHVDERVIITLYLGVSFNVNNVINTLWSDNLFAAISPSVFLSFMYSIGETRDCTLAYLYSRKNRIYMRTFSTVLNGATGIDGLSASRNYDSTNGIKYVTASQTSTILMEHMSYLTSLAITNAVKINESWTNKCALLVWMTHKAGFCLQTPESVETTVMTNINNDTFADLFESNLFVTGLSFDNVSYTDYRGRLPVNQFTITSLKHYDYNQHDWVDETFTQDTSYLYDKQMYKGMWYFTTVDGVDGEWWIHINTKTDYPIISMGTVSSTAVIYATDTYWDTSTWVRITLPDDVPVALRNKKFYIINNTDELDPVYSYTKPALTQLNPEYSIPDNGIKMYMNNDLCRNKVILPNPECNCLVHPNVILYPDDTNDIVSYTITNYGDATVTNNYISSQYGTDVSGTLSVFKLTEDGDRLIMAQQGMTNFRSGCYRIYTISDDKTVAPVAKDITVGFTQTSNLTETFHSFTDKGYLVTVHNGDNEIKIIDLYANAGEEVSSITGKWGHALNRTTYCVYQDIDGENALTFVVYDMSTSTIVNRFTLNYNASVNGIGGWKNHVYIRIYDTTSSTYKLIYHNITTDNTIEFDTDPTGASNTSNRSIFNHTNLQSGWDNSFKSCDECMIVPIGIPMPSDNIYPNSAYQGTVMKFKIVFDNNPTEFVTLLSETFTDPANSKTGTITCHTCGNFAYKSDGSFFGLEMIVYNSLESCVADDSYKVDYAWRCASPASSVLFDLGHYLDDGYVPDIYRFNCHNNRSSTWNSSGMLIGYKDHVITPGDNNTLKFIPFERCYIHKLTGTTTSVQTINNPKRIKPNNAITFTAQN